MNSKDRPRWGLSLQELVSVSLPASWRLVFVCGEGYAEVLIVLLRGLLCGDVGGCMLVEGGRVGGRENISPLSTIFLFSP